MYPYTCSNKKANKQNKESNPTRTDTQTNTGRNRRQFDNQNPKGNINKEILKHCE